MRSVGGAPSVEGVGGAPMWMGAVLPVWKAGVDRYLSQFRGCDHSCRVSLIVNYSQQLTNGNNPKSPASLREKEFNRKQQTNPFLPLPCGPGGLEDRGGRQLLVPFVQKPRGSPGAVSCPLSPYTRRCREGGEEWVLQGQLYSCFVLR